MNANLVNLIKGIARFGIGFCVGNVVTEAMDKAVNLDDEHRTKFEKVVVTAGAVMVAMAASAAVAAILVGPNVKAEEDSQAES